MAKKQTTIIGDFVAWLEHLYKKAPQLPPRWRELTATLLPWIFFISGILGILLGLLIMGAAPLALISLPQKYHMYYQFDVRGIVFVTGVLTVLLSGFLLYLYSRLALRRYRGWAILFWLTVLYGIGSVLSFALGSLLWTALCLYLLFAIKHYYK